MSRRAGMMVRLLGVALGLCLASGAMAQGADQPLLPRDGESADSLLPGNAPVGQPWAGHQSTSWPEWASRGDDKTRARAIVAQAADPGARPLRPSLVATPSAAAAAAEPTHPAVVTPPALLGGQPTTMTTMTPVPEVNVRTAPVHLPPLDGPVTDATTAPPSKPSVLLPTAASPSPVVIATGEPVTKIVSVDSEGQIIRVPIGHSRILDLGIPPRDVIVSNPGIADVLVKRTRQVLVMGRAPGQTNIIFLDGLGRVSGRVEVQVHIDVDTLNDTLRRVLPGERIRAESVGGTVILTGLARSPLALANAAQLARRFVLDDPSVVNLAKVRDEQQILLRVKVVEMNRNAVKDLGLYPFIQNLALGPWLFNLAPVDTALGLTGAGFAAGTLTAGASPTWLAEHMVAAFRLLEQQGIVRSLAEPNLTAISGERAYMLAGGQIPVISSRDENGRETYELHNFGVSLGFVPVALSGDRISLRLAAEVSSIDPALRQGLAIGFATRRAETSIELPSGGSIMIAGLLRDDVSNAINGLPGLKDVPVLGQLFRSESFRRQETELVIIVTALIIKPQDPNTLATPSDGFMVGSDLDHYLLGQLHRVYGGGARPPPAESVVGPFGYIID